MRKLKLLLPIPLALAVAAPFAFGASSVGEGTYAGQAKGFEASVRIDADGSGAFTYSLKSACGRSQGKVALDDSPGGVLKGSRRFGKSLVATQLKLNDAGHLDGMIRHKTKSKGKRGTARCRAKTNFALKPDDVVEEIPPAVKSDIGHYEGSGEDGGHPISFDVGFDEKAGALEITAMSFRSDSECFNDFDGDGEDDTLVVNVTGLEGPVEKDGSFDLDLILDEDTQFFAEGVLRDGSAEMDIEVGGYFAPDGTPQIGGPFECDSFGEIYRATKR